MPITPVHPDSTQVKAKQSHRMEGPLVTLGSRHHGIVADPTKPVPWPE